MAVIPETADSIAERMRYLGVKYMRFEMPDFFDRSRTTLVPQKMYHQLATDGLGLPLRGVFNDQDSNCKSVYQETIGTLKPDFGSSILRLPHGNGNGMALTLAEPHLNGNPLPTFPRCIARKQLRRLEELGFKLKSAFHLEFFLNAPEDKITPILLADLLDTLRGLGMDPEYLNIGKTRKNIDGTYTEKAGIEGADMAHLFKSFMKEAVTCHHDFDVSFFKKPVGQVEGNCFLYFRHSLWDAKGEKDLTYDGEGSAGLSETARHWMAGILQHMPAVSRFMFPTDFCWKHRSRFDPMNDRWGKDSTASSLRLHVGGEGKTFMETRLGTGRCNPYLLLASVVAAGIDGIEKNLPLPEEGVGSGKELPTFLKQATEAFEADEILKDAFGAGEDFIALLKARFPNTD